MIDKKNVIYIQIEKSSDCYGAYATNVEGIYGAGDTLPEVKQSIQDGIDSIMKYFETHEIPDALKNEYELVYLPIIEG
jgi:predicted RNase H-like HicB family nuclease